MAQLSKQALKVENNESFPNNNTNYITPAILRSYNTDIIDSMVDEIPFVEFTQSVNTSINALNQFTASASGLNTGSLLVTASAASNVITFTKGDASQFSVTVADTTNLTPLNNFTASAQISLNNLDSWTSSYQPVITNLQASQSIDNTKFTTIGTQSGSWDNTSLNAYTASNDTKWSNIASQSGSWVTESETGSFAKTDASNTFTQANTFTSISASSFVSASAFVGNGSKLTGITASVSLPILDEGIPQGNAVSMNFTGSGISATIVGGTAIVSVNTPDSGTINNLTASFNSYTASNNQKWDNIALQSGSWGGGDITALNAFTASQNTKNTTLASVTASLQQQLTNIGGQSGSWITESETGSFAYINKDNAWSANQTFTNITAVSASFQYVQTTYETSSVIYSSGSNQFGDASNDVQTLYGSTRVMNELTASGLHYPTADGTFAGQTLQTDAAGNLSFADVTTIYETVHNSEATTLVKGTVVYISGSTGANPNVYRADSANAAKMPVSHVIAEAITAGATGRGITLGLLTGIDMTGLVAGTQLWADGTGTLTATRPTGANDIIQPVAVVTKTGSGGQINILNPGPVLMPNMQTGYTFVGNGSNQPTLVATSSFGTAINTGSFATTGSNTFNGSQTITGSINLSGLISGSGAQFQNSLAIGDSGYFRFLSGSEYYNVQLVPGVGDIAFSRNGVSNTKVLTLAGTAGASTTFQNNPVDFQATVSGVSFNQPIVLNNGINSNTQITGSLIVSQNTNIAGTLTASLQQGYVWVGDSTSKTTLVATSSFITTINTGSFATTGSNNFIGVETIGDMSLSLGAGVGEVYMLGRSGSLIIGNSVATPTYAALSHISSSQINANTNFIFKSNTNTSDTIISGSNNIFVNPAANTAGFKRFLTAGNFMLASTSVPQVSGSMAFPITISNNSILGAGSMTMRGPVSSSAWNISNNTLLGTAALSLGTSAANNTEKAVAGINAGANVLLNTISVIANKTTLNQAITFNNNISVFGNISTNANSSSIQFSGNLGGGITINNNSEQVANLSANQSNLVGIAQNLFGGASNTLNFSGSANGVGSAANNKTLNYNQILGYGNVVGLVASGLNEVTGATQLNATMIAGNQLIITGSDVGAAGTNLPNIAGGAHFGRYNANDSRRNTSGENIFSVGTGTSTSNRKTGFLIDSGSNTYVEGSLNVSGSTSFTGSAPSILSGSFSGSLITNLTDTYTDVAAVQQIVSLSSGSYAGLVSGSLTNTNTLYIIV